MVSRIGTQGSNLSLWQANFVKDRLADFGIQAELVEVNTVGDYKLEGDTGQAGDKELFIKGIDEAMQKGEIDIAVVSSNEIPSRLPSGLEILAILKREDPRDVLLSNGEEIDIDNLAADFLIGTSSLCGMAFMKHYVPNFRVKKIGGSVDARVAQMQNGELDGIILAYSDAKQMNYSKLIVRKLNVSSFTPEVGQGAIGVMARTDFSFREGFRKALNHSPSEQALICERSFLQKMDFGYPIPIFGLATVINESLSFSGGIAAGDGTEIIRESMDGKVGNAAEIGREVAEIILKKGGKKLVHGKRNEKN